MIPTSTDVSLSIVPPCRLRLVRFRGALPHPGRQMPSAVQPNVNGSLLGLKSQTCGPRPAAATRGGSSVALTDSEEPARPSLLGSWSQLKARLLDAEHMLVQRLAGTVFLIRVFSAVLAFGS